MLAFFAGRNYQAEYSELINGNHNRVVRAMQKLVVIVEGLILPLLWTLVWGYYLKALLTRWRSNQQRTKREWRPKPRSLIGCA
jgi:hypothetical protein